MWHTCIKAISIKVYQYKPLGTRLFILLFYYKLFCISFCSFNFLTCLFLNTCCSCLPLAFWACFFQCLPYSTTRLLMYASCSSCCCTHSKYRHCQTLNSLITWNTNNRYKHLYTCQNTTGLYKSTRKRFLKCVLKMFCMGNVLFLGGSMLPSASVYMYIN